ncbi:MAG: hypothetical protein ACOC14_03570 [Bacillota bacterium]
MIELEGIVGTIHTYTKNPFMVGYTKQLRKAMENNDFDTAKIVLDKVIGWYNEEYDKIQHDRYVFNKQMHEKAYSILTKYRQAIQT